MQARHPRVHKKIGINPLKRGPINLCDTKIGEKDEKTRKKPKIFVVIAHNA
jgi:hypothetical protein